MVILLAAVRGQLRAVSPRNRPRVMLLNQIHKQKQTNKLHGLSPQANYSDQRRLSAKLTPTFADKGVSRSQHGGSPMAVISAF
jgi:hypothetical protein